MLKLKDAKNGLTILLKKISKSIIRRVFVNTSPKLKLGCINILTRLGLLNYVRALYIHAFGKERMQIWTAFEYSLLSSHAKSIYLDLKMAIEKNKENF